MTSMPVESSPISCWDVGPHYAVCEVLGQGSYGQVATGVDRRTNKRVAIKRINKIFSHIVDTRRLLREIHVLRNLNHPNIVRLLDVVYHPADEVLEGVASEAAERADAGAPMSPPAAVSPAPSMSGTSKSGSDQFGAAFQSHFDRVLASMTARPRAGAASGSKPAAEDKAVQVETSAPLKQLDVIYLVFQHCDTDLHKLIVSPQYLSELHIQTFLYQLLCAVRYLHSGNIIHRDVKPANILVNEDCTLLLCDFGLARVLPVTAPGDPAASVDSDASTKSLRAPAGSVAEKRPSEDSAERRTHGSTSVLSPGGGYSSAATSGYMASSSSPEISDASTPATGKPLTGNKRGRTAATTTKADAADRASMGGIASGVESETGDGSEPCKSASSSSEPDEPAAKRARFTLPDGTTVDGESLDSKSSLQQNKEDSLASSRTSGNRALSRQMTRHVVTRFYRAPELILLQDYSIAVDMWSVGCVFAELLSMQAESVASHRDRRPLFPGRSCFPLSADNPTTHADRMDQLNLILNVMGSPAVEDMVDCDPVVQTYLKKLPPRPATPLYKKFKGASSEALDLLSKLLSFSASRRITVADALEHPFVRPIRDLDPQHRRERVSPPQAVDATVTERELEMPDLQRLILAEVLALKLTISRGGITSPRMMSASS